MHRPLLSWGADMSLPPGTPAAGVAPSSWDHGTLAHMDAAEARRILRTVEELPSAGVLSMLLNGAADGAASIKGAPSSLLSAVVRLYPLNRVPLGMALQLLGRLDSETARTVWLSRGDDGATALMDACRMVPRADDLVQLLLAAGAGTTMNASDSDGRTALMFASRDPSSTATRLLVDHHADVDQLDAYGRSALHHACETVATGPAMVLVGADATIHRGALGTCAGSAARVVCACALGVLLLVLLVAWLAQRVHCLHPICPSLFSPPHKKSKKRRNTSVETATLPRNTPVGRPLMRYLSRPALRAVVPILTVALTVPWLLYQQAQIHRALEMHGQQMTTIHWELFAFAQVVFFLTAAALFPDLSPAGCTPRQREWRLVATRAAVVLATAYVVGTARYGLSARRILAFVPPSAGIVDVTTGHLPLKLSTWIRFCCAVHTSVFEMVMLPVFLAGLQITEKMSARFPAWMVARGLFLSYGLNDLFLFCCTSIYLRLLATAGGAYASGHRVDVAARSDVAAVGALFMAMRVHGPVQLLLAATLTPENRLRLAGCLAGCLNRGPVDCLQGPNRSRDVGRPAEGETRDDEPPGEVERDCVVCLDGEATHILAPCGHRCVCAVCSAHVTECPLCRASIASVISKVW